MKLSDPARELVSVIRQDSDGYLALIWLVILCFAVGLNNAPVAAWAGFSFAFRMNLWRSKWERKGK